MDVPTLARLPTLALSGRDRDALTAWLAEDDTPLKETAAEMLRRGVKAEQEGWFLSHGA